MATEEFKEINEGVKMMEGDKEGELDMGVLDNRTKVLDTLERVEKVEVEDLVDVVDLKKVKEWKDMKELKEMKAVGEPREKRASFYKSGSELAYQVNKMKSHSLFHIVGF